MLNKKRTGDIKLKINKKCSVCNFNNSFLSVSCKKCGVPLNINSRKPEEKFSALLEAAQKGYDIAQYEVGVIYENGEGVFEDYVEAAKWFLKAADQGNVEAQLKLGFYYDFGIGVLQDFKKAVSFYYMAAEQDNCTAQFNLGRHFEEGYGVPQDDDKAFKWFQKAAENGDSKAQSKLGQYYENGQGVLQNYSLAFEWYQKAAEQGDAYAANSLAYYYFNGLGTSQNYEDAFKWYEKAAEQKLDVAQYNLGLCYSNGWGVDQDYVKAIRWYKRAAEQEYVEAIYKLGCCYEYGTGTEQDFTEAIKWYHKAELFKDSRAKKAQKRVKKKAESYKEQQFRESISEKNTDENPSKIKGIETGDKTVEALLSELNAMIGLNSVKKEVKNKIDRIRISQNAKMLGSKRKFSSDSLHMIFAGNPGTGKTTVARLLGQIYGELGVIKNPDNFVECGRNDLVSCYIGQTASQVKMKFEEAKGGILFIDEAYSLYKPDDSRDFGHEAIDTIVQYMDSYRNEIIVIVAGYSSEMDDFIKNSNPGLASRFRTTIHFEDYTPSELFQIMEYMVKKEHMTIKKEAVKPLEKVIGVRSRQPGFGNARGIRNLFEDLKEIHDVHLAELMDNGVDLSAEMIECITAEDVKRLSYN